MFVTEKVSMIWNVTGTPSFLQLASKKGDGFDGFGAPDPFNQNDDDEVDPRPSIDQQAGS